MYSIRSYASIDHFCPLINKNINDKDKILLFVHNPVFNIFSHLIFKKINNKSIKIIEIRNFNNFFIKFLIGFKNYFDNVFINLKSANILLFKVSNILQFLINRLQKDKKKLFLKKVYPTICQLLSNEYNKRYLYIDSDNSDFTKFAHQYLQKLDFISISYPHGINICSNELRTINSLFYEKYLIDSGKSFSFCDNIIFHNDIETSKITDKNKKDYPFDKYKYVRSERFSFEWLDYSIKNVSVDLLNVDKSKINVCILFPKLLNGIFVDELFRCVKILNDFEIFNVIIKLPFKHIESVIFKLKKRNFKNVYFDNINPTTNIINISDTIIFADANVVIDAFILNKKVVALDYIYMNSLYFDNSNEINFIRNRDEFHNLFHPTNYRNIKNIGKNSKTLNEILPFQNIYLKDLFNEK